MGKTGYIPVGYPWTLFPYPTRPVRHLPDPTRTRGNGSGRVYPWVWVDPHTSTLCSSVTRQP